VTGVGGVPVTGWQPIAGSARRVCCVQRMPRSRSKSQSSSWASSSSVRASLWAKLAARVDSQPPVGRIQALDRTSISARQHFQAASSTRLDTSRKRPRSLLESAAGCTYVLALSALSVSSGRWYPRMWASLRWRLEAVWCSPKLAWNSRRSSRARNSRK